MSIKRPGGGVSPFKYWEFIGKKSKNNYEIGDLINE
jgi:N-acetylneuraminate synthase